LKNKSIFIYVNQGFSARHLLRSSTLPTLVKNSSHVVILSHNGDEKVFKDSYESDNVKVKKFENEKCEEYLKNNRLQNILIPLRAYVLNGSYDTKTVDDFRKIFLGQLRWTKTDGYGRWIKGLLWESASWLLKNNKMIRKLLIKFETIFFNFIPQGFIQKIFSRSCCGYSTLWI
jgi:hypothetical protein